MFSRLNQSGSQGNMLETVTYVDPQHPTTCTERTCCSRAWQNVLSASRSPPRMAASNASERSTSSGSVITCRQKTKREPGIGKLRVKAFFPLLYSRMLHVLLLLLSAAHVPAQYTALCRLLQVQAVQSSLLGQAARQAAHLADGDAA